MYKNLCAWVFPGGHELTFTQIVTLSQQTGYRGIEVRPGEITELSKTRSISWILDTLAEHGLRPGGWQVDDRWRGNEEAYRTLLEELPCWARTMKQIDSTRAFLWAPSYSDERAFDENFAWHVKRLRPIAAILKDHGCRFGLEWQGPKTLRTKSRYEFIHTMAGMKKLLDAIGTDNLGFLLDYWHWYTSYGTLDDLRALQAEDIVYVHISDGPMGVPIDEQKDDVREVPGATGVIDLVGALRILQDCGYDGPVEPSVVGSPELAGLSIEAAARRNAEALGNLFEDAGIVEKQQ